MVHIHGDDKYVVQVENAAAEGGWETITKPTNRTRAFAAAALALKVWEQMNIPVPFNYRVFNLWTHKEAR